MWLPLLLLAVVAREGSGQARGLEQQQPQLPNIPPIFGTRFQYQADNFLQLPFYGVRGEHSPTSPPVDAWRLDVLLGDMNVTTIRCSFSNGTVRDTSFFSAGEVQEGSSRVLRMLQAPGMASIAVEDDDVFVFGCAQGSQAPFGLIGVDLDWVTDPEFGTKFVGKEVINNVTTDHWQSTKCRDIWLITEPSGMSRPIKTKVQDLDKSGIGCDPTPVQTAMYETFEPLSVMDGAVSSPLFLPPAQCFPSDSGGGKGHAGDGSIPPWVWAVMGALGVLGLASIAALVLGSCRRGSEDDLDEMETRERFSSRLLDVI